MFLVILVPFTSIQCTYRVIYNNNDNNNNYYYYYYFNVYSIQQRRADNRLSSPALNTTNQHHSTYIRYNTTGTGSFIEVYSSN